MLDLIEGCVVQVREPMVLVSSGDLKVPGTRGTLNFDNVNLVSFLDPRVSRRSACRQFDRARPEEPSVRSPTFTSVYEVNQHGVSVSRAVTFLNTNVNWLCFSEDQILSILAQREWFATPMQTTVFFFRRQEIVFSGFFRIVYGNWEFMLDVERFPDDRVLNPCRHDRIIVPCFK